MKKFASFFKLLSMAVLEVCGSGGRFAAVWELRAILELKFGHIWSDFEEKGQKCARFSALKWATAPKRLRSDPRRTYP